jgi:hypothetical protein
MRWVCGPLSASAPGDPSYFTLTLCWLTDAVCRIKNAYFVIPALFTLPAALCFAVGINFPSNLPLLITSLVCTGCCVSIGASTFYVKWFMNDLNACAWYSMDILILHFWNAQLLGNTFVWTYMGPINSVSMTVMPPNLRARASGVAIFFQVIHSTVHAYCESLAARQCHSHHIKSFL